jgi:hypothetical protein
VKYEDIVFICGDEATEPLKILDKHGRKALLDYLLQWDYGEERPVRDETAAGRGDTQYRSGQWLVSYNLRLGYCGLERAIESEAQA